jgi:drug/metabolite transporter (DMT)-like permease
VTSSRTLRGVALVVVWSSGFIGAELGARHAGPDTVLAWRCLVTAVVLLPWALRALTRLGGREWARQAVLALLCQCLYLAGVFWAAAAGIPAGTSALIASLQPALVLTAAVLSDGRRIRAAHLAGLALGTTGVALTAAGDLSAGVALPALLLPLLAMLSLTAGTLLQQRWSTPRLPLLPTLAVQAVFTAGFFTAYGAAAGSLTPPPSTGFWVAVAWAAAAGIGSYGVYYLVTTRDGAARASTLLYLTPAATALWAVPMFGEPLRAAAVLGLLISAVAVVLLRTASARPVVNESFPAGARPPGSGTPPDAEERSRRFPPCSTPPSTESGGNRPTPARARCSSGSGSVSGASSSSGFAPMATGSRASPATGTSAAKARHAGLMRRTGAAVVHARVVDGELTVLMADGGDRLVPPGDAPVSWSRAGADAVTDR